MCWIVFVSLYCLEFELCIVDKTRIVAIHIVFCLCGTSFIWLCSTVGHFIQEMECDWLK